MVHWYGSGCLENGRRQITGGHLAAGVGRWSRGPSERGLRMVKERSSSLRLDLDGLLNVRPGVNARNSTEGGTEPVDDEELHGGVAAAAELEAGGEDGVEVAAAGAEGSADHAGGHEAVDSHGVLRLLHGDQPRADPAHPGGHSLDNGTVEDRH